MKPFLETMKRSWKWCGFLWLICMLFFCYSSADSQICNEEIRENTQLIQVHALFRHGERTTEEFYPNDPHINNSFYPIGKGSLTNIGKMQEYNLGRFLRNRYNDLLGPYFMDEIMEVRSTGFGRTRTSALLVLAGLWPPRDKQIWNKALLWNPIPVDYKIQKEDDLLNVDLCPRRKQIVETQHEQSDVQEKYIEPYKDLYKYTTENSGWEIKNPVKMSLLFLIFKTEKDALNWSLPVWTNEIYPEPLYQVARLAYNYVNYNPEARTINTGYLLQKIINDMKNKINGNYNNNEKKIMLYSGHESTVGVLLDVFSVKPHIPNYSSCVIIELHKGLETNDYYVKILYKRDIDDWRLEEVLLPGCGSLLSLDNFEEIFENVLPKIPFKQACIVK